MPNYNTPMLHFAPHVTFQPCVRQILAHCTSPFGPVAMPTNEHPPPPPPIIHPKVIWGGKALKKT